MNMASEPGETKRIGKGMLWIFWCLVLACLVFLFGNMEKKRINPNQTVSGISSSNENIVELQRNVFGHYVANGKINEDDVVFMLDTGATNVAIPQKLAERLGLKRGARQQVYTANGIATAYATEIQSLRLGNIQLNDVKASITPGMTGDEILLGMSALKQLDFSQSGKVLTLSQPN